MCVYFIFAQQILIDPLLFPDEEEKKSIPMQKKTPRTYMPYHEYKHYQIEYKKNIYSIHLEIEWQQKNK